MLPRVEVVSLGTLLLALAVGCNEKPKPPPKYQIVVRVEGDPGEPIANANIKFQTQRVGRTDKTGVAKLELSGAEGQQFPLTVECPEGYEPPTEKLMVTLRKIEDTSKPITFNVLCPPSERHVVVAVRAENGPNLPVTYLGKQVATTDRSGAAHVYLKVQPNTSIELGLDTSSNGRLIPKNPRKTFTVQAEDAVFLFSPEFKKKAVRRYYRRRRTPRLPQPI